MTRHCMVVHSYYPLGEVRVEREAKALIDAGFDVDVICLRGDGERAIEEVDGVTVYRLPVSRHKGKGMAFQMVEYLAFFILATAKLTARHLRHRYQTVQIHNLPDFLVFSAIVPKLTGAGIILDLHDLMPEFLAAKTGGNLDGTAVGLVKLQERWACRFADRVITVTSQWRETLLERGVPPEKVGVVMNLADPSVFLPRGEHPRKASSFQIVYHGTLTARYGIALAIEAVTMLREEIDGLQFRIMGSGEALDDLRRQVSDLGVDDIVRLPEGFVPMDELVAVLAEADAGVVPNLGDVFTDGILPTKLLEYVTIGIPVVASHTSGVSAYFDDTMVEFFEPGDVEDLAAAIRRLYDDPGRAERKAEMAASFNRVHPWESLASEYVEMVTNLAKVAS